MLVRFILTLHSFRWNYSEIIAIAQSTIQMEAEAVAGMEKAMNESFARAITKWPS